MSIALAGDAGRSGPLALRGHVGDVLAQRSGQVDLVFLLLDQDAADGLRQGVLAERLALADPLAVVADGVVLVVQVEAQPPAETRRDWICRNWR